VRDVRHVIEVLTVVAACAVSASSEAATARKSFPLREWEAKTLVFLAPDVQRAVRAGFEIGFGPQSGPHLNTESFFVDRTIGECDNPSGLIGTYAVNRYTAEVIDFGLDVVVHSRDLDAVQSALRRAHRIGAAVIAAHRNDNAYRE
jgi:hypothetical protein